ncbi:MAG: hypothetical protein M1118_04975 [Chloroflexi bacterium]|nr:hypothetical protein [Chloroflexota bacterium]
MLLQVREAAILDTIRLLRTHFTPIGGTPALIEHGCGVEWLRGLTGVLSGRQRWIVASSRRRILGAIQMAKIYRSPVWQIVQTSSTTASPPWLEDTLQSVTQLAGFQGIERLTASVIEHDARIAAFLDAGFRPVGREELFIWRGSADAEAQPCEAGELSAFRRSDEVPLLRLVATTVPVELRRLKLFPHRGVVDWMGSRAVIVGHGSGELTTAVGVLAQRQLGHAVIRLWALEEHTDTAQRAVLEVTRRLQRDGFQAVWLIAPSYDFVSLEVARASGFGTVTERLQLLKHTTALVRQPSFQRLPDQIKTVPVAEGPSLSARTVRLSHRDQTAVVPQAGQDGHELVHAAARGIAG